MNRKITAKLSYLLGIVGLYCASFIKLNYMFGTLFSFFSATQIISPLLGLYGGTTGSLFIFALRTLFYAGTHVSSLPFLLLHHLPTLMASLYLSNKNPFLKVVPSIVCMILFIMHPVGSKAAIYSVFWLVPLLLQLMKNTSFFGNALGATMSAHAVGSLLFLYSRPTCPQLWYSLMPIVPFERLLIAGGISIAFMCTQIIISGIKKIVTKEQRKFLTHHD